MKTFTTYATKAKQFLNLLQGYTRGIRITAILILLLMGVSNAWAWWFVPGSWNGWDSKEANSGGVAQMNGSNTITFYNVPAGSYEMKLIKGSDWGNGNYTNKSNSYISSVSKGTNGGNDKIKLSKACDLTFTITDQNTWKCDVSASDPSYYIKYDWNGSGWVWSGSLTSSNSYSCTGQYGGSGSFDHTRVSSTDVDGTNATATLVNSPSKGDLCVFTYNTSNKSLTITRCNKVTANSKIYFDNSLTNWSNSNIYFVVGHDKPTAYSKVYKMNAVNNTKLFYAEISETWEDATYYAIVGVDNEWSNGNWGSSNLTSATKYTKAYTAKYDLGTNGCYYITPSTGNNNTAFTITYKEGYNNIPKITATQSAKIRNSITDQQYTTATETWPATLKLEGTHLTGFGNDKSARSTISSTTSGSDVNYEAVVTGKITHSYSNLSEDYQFDGWGTSTPAAGNTYEYHITAATTVYAFFTKKYEVTFGVHSLGGGSISATAGSTPITSGEKVVGGSQIIFTATPSAGYQIEGWYSNSACTTPIDNGTHDTYTVTITDGTNVYVKYEEIPEDKFAVEISTDGNGTVDLSASEQIGKSGNSITATPNEGFDFDHWEVDGGATVADEKAANTTITATKEGSVTACFKEIMRTISVTCNNANYGTVSPTSTKAGIATPSENITATPAEGYELTGWSVTSGSNNITLSSTTATTIQVTQAKVDGSISATFQEKKYNITVLKDGKTSTTQQIGAKTQVSITATNRTGYQFVKWIVSSEQTPGCITIDDPTKQTAKVTATGTGTITAIYKETGVLYFKNNLGWSNVYVYFHTGDSYWDATFGSGSYGLTIANGRAFKMERIGNTDIYKCHYGAKGTVPTNSLAFTPENKEDNGNFHKTKASYRTDFNSQMELFIPQNTKTETKNETDYYNNGVWMKYNSTESGYSWSSDQNSWNTTTNPLVAKVAGGYSFSTTIKLTHGTTYKFKISNSNNVWFGNTGTMTEDNCTGWTFESREWGEDEDNGNAKITPTVTGDYIFTLYLGDGKVSISLEYPLATNDYRLAYIEGDDKTTLHPNHHFKRRTTGAEILDTLSFFVRRDKSPKILLQHCSGFDNNQNPTWVTDVTYPVSLDSTAVYNFVFKQTNSGNEHTKELDQTKTHLYSGDYYIRTDAAPGGWDSFRQKSNQITYSSFADAHSNFNHYFCEWITANRNVKFTIANDYSYCISDTLDRDNIINKDGVSPGCLPADANVRFGWNSKTNEVSRAYISGSAKASDRFLVLTGNEYLLNIDSTALNVSGLKANEALFADKQNWIYQLDVQANSNTEITLTAQYNGKVQTFFGTSKSGFGGEPIMQATNDDYHKVRMIYDFKTNNLIAAWLLDETQYPKTTSVASNMLIIRENQGNANQINFTKINNQNMEINTAYAVMTFTKTHIDDKDLSERERSEYWVSFPFDVKISDVFGFSEYGDKWIMQLYDGAERAEKGYWIDSPTFWKYITNRNYTLKAGVGYVLKLNLNKMDFPNNSTDASLFFPSQGIPTVINAEPTPITVPAHECTIERDYRNIRDSHWNLIGVPGYANLNTVNTKYTTGNQADGVNFYYAYNAQKNKYAAAAATATFKNMHAYMVQFAGTIDWKNVPQFNNIPQQLAARRNSDAEPEKRTLRLEIAQGEEVADQTFVQLQQEGATAEFDMNLDLTKIINSGANIYTLAGDARIQVAGNALPVAETTIPVGVQMATEGEYTFRMPEGTEGMVVELIDYYTNTRTNLLLFDYTVELSAGTCDDRFALHIQPEKSGVATDIDQLTGSDLNAEGVQKYIIDGKLIIRTAEGEVFDAQGHRL